jgi:hypothetical protein
MRCGEVWVFTQVAPRRPPKCRKKSLFQPQRNSQGEFTDRGALSQVPARLFPPRARRNEKLIAGLNYSKHETRTSALGPKRMANRRRRRGFLIAETGSSGTLSGRARYSWRLLSRLLTTKESRQREGGDKSCACLPVEPLSGVHMVLPAWSSERINEGDIGDPAEPATTGVHGRSGAGAAGT